MQWTDYYLVKGSLHPYALAHGSVGVVAKRTPCFHEHIGFAHFLDVRTAHV